MITWCESQGCLRGSTWLKSAASTLVLVIMLQRERPRSREHGKKGLTVSRQDCVSKDRLLCPSHQFKRHLSLSEASGKKVLQLVCQDQIDSQSTANHSLSKQDNWKLYFEHIQSYGWAQEHSELVNETRNYKSSPRVDQCPGRFYEESGDGVPDQERVRIWLRFRTSQSPLDLSHLVIRYTFEENPGFHVKGRSPIIFSRGEQDNFSAVRSRWGVYLADFPSLRS